MHQLIAWPHARVFNGVVEFFLNKLEELKNSPFKVMAALGRTFCLWKDEIVRMWRFRKSNGITIER